MKIFISWSGEKARRVAEALKVFLKDVNQYLKPWVSESDILAGERWGNKLTDELETTDYGIICVTQESLQKPWPMFEAGALSKSVINGRVCPYLIDIDPPRTELSGPLSQFQAKKANRTETLEMLQSINRSMPNGGLSEENLRRYCEERWPALEAALQNANRELPAPEPLQFCLTESSAKSIAAYLRYKGRKERDKLDSGPFLKIDREKDIAQNRFEKSCQQAWDEVDIYESLKNALHQPFGLYVSARGAYEENFENTRDLAYCMRSGFKGKTYLSHVIDTSKQVSEFIEHDAREIDEKKFPHMLLDSEINPVPLAVVVQCKKEANWSAKVFTVYTEPLLFSINASETSNDYEPTRTKLYEKMAVPYIVDILGALKKWYDGKSNYMGTDIRSVLYLPIHGRPSVTLSFLTRRTIKLTGVVPPDGNDPEAIGLSVDELLAMRLAGERFIAVLNHYHSAQEPDPR